MNALAFPSTLVQTKWLSPWRLLTLAALLAWTPGGVTKISAATLVWDPSATTTGSNGSGTWDNATAIWATGGANVIFPSAAQTTNTAQVNSGTNTITVANVTGLAAGQAISSAAFAVGTTILEINGNVVTMSANATTNIGNNSTLVFAVANDVVFGTGSGVAGTVAVSGFQAADSLTINAAAGGGNYVFNGGSITLGARNGSSGALVVNSSATINSALSWKSITFNTAGQTLTLNGGSVAGSPVGAFNGAVTGNTASAATSTLAVTGGLYTTGGAGQGISIGNQTAETGGLQMSGGTITAGGNFQVGNDRAGFANLSGGTINSTGQFTIGRNGLTNIGKVVVSGGTLNQTGASTTDTSLAIGRGNGIGTLDVRSGIVNVIGNGITGNAGGILALNADATNAAASGTLIISGGTVTVKELRLNGGNSVSGRSSFGSSTVTMTGGALYIGGTVRDTNTTTTAGGLVNYGIGTSTYSVTLSGGLVGANANWSSNLNMTLGTTNGNVTFKAADVANVARNITLSSTLSGAGGLTKTGLGTLSLQGLNTYAGNTLINEGTFSLESGGGMTFYIGANGVNNSITGTGTVTLNGAFTFDITAAASLGDWQIINVSTLNETYGTNFAVTGFTESEEGIWTQGDFRFSEVTGMLTAVPEPSRAVLLLGGIFLFALRRRR